MPLPRILVIEDDAAIRRGVVDALQMSGFAPVSAGRADEGLKLGLSGQFELVLLDLVLPGGSGWDILRSVRAAQPVLPIIILTACGAEEQRINGLQLGADDYVVKPFSLRELLARVEAVLRRSPTRSGPPAEIAFAGGTIDVSRRQVLLADGEDLELSEKETDLLLFLALRPGEVVSREQLLSGVWGLNPKGLNTRTVDMHVARLREKLHDDPAQPQILKTVWGKGYQFLGTDTID